MTHAKRLRLAAAAVLSLASSVTPHAVAQTPVQRPTPLPALGRNMVSNGDSTSMVQNPANIAFMPGPELRYAGYFLGDASEDPTGGHAFAFALPFGFIPVSTGLRFDMVTPSRPSSNDMFGSKIDYQWLTWAIALGTDTAALGFSFQRSFSSSDLAAGYGTWNAGLTLRPTDYFGMAGVIARVDAPTSQGFGDTDCGVGQCRLGTEYQLAGVIRPLGSDLFELGAEGNFVDEQGGYWIPRFTADLGIPGLGRIRGDVAWADPGELVGESSWVASTALVVQGNARSGSGELTLGTRYGSGLGDTAEDRVWENIHVEVAAKSFREPRATDNFPYALRVRIEQTPSVREHTALLRNLWAMASEEPSLKGILLELRAKPASSLAHLEELQDALFHLRAKGKYVLCHIEAGDGASLFLCGGAADKTLLNPAGNIRYQGLKSQSFYIKGLLDKLGIQADFVRIGKHKSAPEMFVRKRGSKTAVDDRTDLLQQVELELSSSIATGRHMSVEALREKVANGPFSAAEAKTANLVDGFAFDDMLQKELEKATGSPLVLEGSPRGKTRPSRFGPARRVAIVYVEGDMVDGRSTVFPFVGIRTAGSYTIAESLQQVRKDPSIAAVVLRVETGGGSAMAADVIWREVQLTAAEKPVVVSMGSAAASGGYYISSPGSYVYANPLSITGSIGIFFGKVDVSGLLRKIGVNVETLKTTDRADADAIFRPFSDEERHALSGKIEQSYGLFLRRVADGRSLTTAEVDAVGRGRVWTGRQAKEHRLVDDIGGLRQALAKARVMGGIPDDAPIIELPVPQMSLLGRLLGIEGIKSELSAKSTPPLPGELLDLVRGVAPYALYASDQPLARVEFLPSLLP